MPKVTGAESLFHKAMSYFSYDISKTKESFIIKSAKIMIAMGIISSNIKLLTSLLITLARLTRVAPKCLQKLAQHRSYLTSKF